MANRLTRRLRIVALISALATAAVVVPSVAVASPSPKKPPKPTVASVEKELATLAIKNTQLVERYNQARIAVASRQKAVVAAQAVVTAADAQVSQAHVLLSRSALAEFEGGSFSSAGALLSSSNGSSYIDQLQTMQMITTHSAQVVSMYLSAEQAAKAAKSKAKADLDAANSTLSQLNTARQTVQAQVTKFSKLLATLTAAQRSAWQNQMNPTVTNAQRSAAMANIPSITNAGIRKVVAFAVAQVGKPYSWGSAGPGSYDCSGLTMASYEQIGVNLPHSAADQYNYGHHVSFNDLQPGDLMFFYSPIGHVTMYIGDGMMVSAPQTGEDVKIIPANTFGSSYVGATRLISS